MDNYSLEMALDILQSVNFFGLKSNVLQRACECIVLSKSSGNNFLSLLQVCHYSLKDEALFSQVVYKLSAMSSPQEIIDQIKDVQILQAVIKVLFSQKEEEMQDDMSETASSGGSAFDFEANFPAKQTAMYILSDTLSRVLNGRKQATMAEVVFCLDPFLIPIDPFNSSSSVCPSELAFPVLGKKRVFTKRTGQLCGVLARHLTRIRIR